jgi:glycosyltransferase involved in cell wall biosynthesis
MSDANGLTVIQTHPIQYHAPLFRAIQQDFGIPVTAIYGSDLSVAGYKDSGFETQFAWDTNLLSGYTSRFLAKVSAGGAQAPEDVSSHGLEQTLSEVAPTAIMLLGYSPRFYREAIAAAQKVHCPLLFRAETTDHGPARPWWKGILRDAFLRRLYARCARLLYIGQRSREHFERLGCSESTLVFSPYAVDDASFRTDEDSRRVDRASVRRELRISPEEIVVMFSGKLIPRKRPDLLLTAVRELPIALCGRMSVMFLGDGPLRGDLVRLGASEPALSVHIVGFQNQRSLSRYYNAADLLVLPSTFETWGLVVNEGLNHGLPCVVSDEVGAAPDLVLPGQTGEVFANGSARALTAALQRAVESLGKPDIRDQCRRHVAKYSIQQAAAGVAKAYRSLVGPWPT